MKQIKFRIWDSKKNNFVMGDEGGLDIRKLMLAHAVTGKPLPDHAELSQFTGLYDKNGKEIYENDIVRVAHQTGAGTIFVNGVMTFEESRAQWGTTVISEVKLTDNPNNEMEKTEPPEIVGNIYQNPELLLND